MIPDVRRGGPARIAMWSGPRNISTAMMRAWGNRADTAVIDEPFYAYYLSRTQAVHPGAEEVIRAGETDWRRGVAGVDRAPPAPPPVQQKQKEAHPPPRNGAR